MHFRILGPLCVANERVELTPTAPKVRQVLAFLLVRAGKLVQVGELIDELWGERPPDSAMTTLQTYIYKLRKDVLDQCTTADLHTRSSGYLLDVPPEQGDLLRFEQLSREGRTALDNGDPVRGAERLAEALALWRGSALADIVTGEILSAHVTRLEEERLSILELRIRADLELGRHQQLVSELKMLVSEHPLDERFYVHLMTALHMSGRRYDALATYQRLRKTLLEELGVEPSASVQRLHVSLLDTGTPASPAPEGGQPDTAALSVLSERYLVPAQLPRDTPDLVGREELLNSMRGYLARAGDMPEEAAHSAVRTLCIAGMPGVGKTVLSLRAGHAERAEFPDGQLYAELRGTTGRPADPWQVLQGFLRAIRLRTDEIPDSLQECSKLFRTWSMSRRVLMVLDDAHSAAQVLPLLPASPYCAVIITARWGLYSLPGNRNMQLEPISIEEAVKLIEAVSGFRYVGAERAVVERAARLAGQLPLALRALGSRLAATPTLSIQKLTAQLEDPRRRLDLLSFADLNVRARFEASYQSLDPRARSVFRLVSLLPRPDFSAATVARLVGDDPDAVEAQLIRLMGCNLLSAVGTRRGGEIRYRMHDLLYLYARERMDGEFLEPAQERQEASRRDRDLEENHHKGHSVHLPSGHENPAPLWRSQAAASARTPAGHRENGRVGPNGGSLALS